MAGAADVVAGARVGGLFQLLEHRIGGGVGEGVGVAHGAGNSGDDLPVRQGIAGRIDRLFHQGEVAFGVDHHALRLPPRARAGQHDVGVHVWSRCPGESNPG